MNKPENPYVSVVIEAFIKARRKRYYSRAVYLSRMLKVGGDDGFQALAKSIEETNRCRSTAIGVNSVT